MYFIIRLMILIFLVYIIFGILLYSKQRTILYIPSPPTKSLFQEVYFDNHGVKIKTFIANPKKENAIIYFGGNAENVAHSIGAFASNLPNQTLYFVNYRGYGGSSGEATEEGLYSDALFIYDQIKKDYKNITVIGRSLGSGVATYLASKRQIYKLVLVTPFDSILSVAQNKIPIYPMSIILKDSYNSIGRVSQIRAEKTLIIRGGEDETIPPLHTKRLSDAFSNQALDVICFDNRGHNDISMDERYYFEIKKFLENIKK